MNMAIRIENAARAFKDNLVSQFGLSNSQAEKVLGVFIRIKAIKLDAIGGVYRLKHGAFWDKDVIQRAIES